MSNDNNDMNEDVLIIDDDIIKKYSTNAAIIVYIKSNFKRLCRKDIIKLIKKILKNQQTINISQIKSKYAGFLQYNMSKFDENNNIKDDILTHIREEIINKIKAMNKDLIYSEKKNKNEDNDNYIVSKDSNYEKIRNFICDEGGTFDFEYDFNKQDIEMGPIKNIDYLQYTQIQILSNGIKFDYPIEYVYHCPQCSSRTLKKPYETVCTMSKLKCPGTHYYINGNGEEKSKPCNIMLNPDNEISNTKDCYYYDMNHDGKDSLCGAISFEKIKPGFYEVVLFRIRNPKKTELFHIIDIKPFKSVDINFPKKVEGENFIFTLQKFFDKYILDKTGMEIYGLIPIKCGLIIQAAASYLNEKLIFNLQIVGNASTGKSTVLKYYSFLLHNHLNLSTNGLDISVPGLRGTKHIINLMGKEQKIVTTGYLGTFNTIHIDEAGENKDLIQNLKSFLLEDNYSYNKAGATGIFNKRIAQLNVSENLDIVHLGQYRGMIRKQYKSDNIKIGIDEKEAWDDSWDLHLPLYTYENSYLYKAVKDARTQYYQKQQWWIDGYDYALHERFPFYFYLVNEKENEVLKKIIKKNAARHNISENLALIKVLKSDNIESFFKELFKYKNGDTDIESFNKIDIILDDYNLEADARTRNFFYLLGKLSRVINQRNKMNEEDFDLIRLFIEKINCKLDIMQTVDYKIVGPPDKKKLKERETKIEDETTGDDEFGLPSGDFE